MCACLSLAINSDIRRTFINVLKNSLHVHGAICVSLSSASGSFGLGPHGCIIFYTHTQKGISFYRREYNTSNRLYRTRAALSFSTMAI